MYNFPLIYMFLVSQICKMHIREINIKIMVGGDYLTRCLMLELMSFSCNFTVILAFDTSAFIGIAYRTSNILWHFNLESSQGFLLDNLLNAPLASMGLTFGSLLQMHSSRQKPKTYYTQWMSQSKEFTLY